MDEEQRAFTYVPSIQIVFVGGEVLIWDRWNYEVMYWQETIGM
jgi:hypothetical protein